MEMTFGEALDHARNYYSRNVKPFEQLLGVLLTATQAEAFLKGHERQLAETQAATTGE